MSKKKGFQSLLGTTVLHHWPEELLITMTPMFMHKVLCQRD